jgi:RNA polymerase sigma factor (sigma-70 family)
VSATARLEFERIILPHLGAAYSLARWLLRQPQDAEDAVQEAVLKAFNGFHGYSGGNARAWLLAIVRNTCLTAIERRRTVGKVIVLADSVSTSDRWRDTVPDPSPLQDRAMISEEERRRVHTAIAALPLQFREALVLREFHDLSYRDIADIVGAPVGTVMSRLARARERLASDLDELNTSRPGIGTGIKK